MSKKTMRVKARAKINLYLKILAREESGYHSIETIFHKIDLADDVTIRVKASGTSLKVSGPEVPKNGLGKETENLAYKAAIAYQKATQWPSGVEIEIVKKIPVGGGLGGGSADAAAVLKALNELSPNPLSERKLLALAYELGSDVPFLTIDAPVALAWGHGDKMLALPALPKAEVALILPGVPVSTADAYQWAREWRNENPILPNLTPLNLKQLKKWEGVRQLSANDFLIPVGNNTPEVRLAGGHLHKAIFEGKDMLIRRIRRADHPLKMVPVVGMTGSGSTFFVVGHNLKPILKRYKGPGRIIWTSSSLD